MHPAPSRCPVCQSELTVAKLHCSSCDTSIEGRFASGPFWDLSPEYVNLIITFVRCEGKINRLEQEGRWGSYPTIRNQLHEVIRALGFEPGKEEVVEVNMEKRNAVLEELEAGKISADEAMRIVARRGGVVHVQNDFGRENPKDQV